GQEKVAYRLLEPEHIHGKKILVVGGGDSAIESAMLLADDNEVVISYRGDAFGRIKPGNQDRIQAAVEAGKVKVMFRSNVVRIEEREVILRLADDSELQLPNDQVYIFAGGELPTDFLQKAGITITKR